MIKYRVITELRVCLDGGLELRISYYKDGVLTSSVKPYREYNNDTMNVYMLDVNNYVIGFEYECTSETEIEYTLLKLRVKNRLIQNLYLCERNFLVEKLCNKIKEDSLKAGYNLFMVNAVIMKFREIANFDKLNKFVEEIDKL